MFAENLKQATSFALHHAFPSNGNHPEQSASTNEQAPPPDDKEETLHTTRDDILRLQQISKDVVPTKNNRKRGKETISEFCNSSGTTWLLTIEVTPKCLGHLPMLPIALPTVIIHT